MSGNDKIFKEEGIFLKETTWKLDVLRCEQDIRKRIVMCCSQYKEISVAFEEHAREDKVKASTNTNMRERQKNGIVLDGLVISWEKKRKKLK